MKRLILIVSLWPLFLGLPALAQEKSAGEPSNLTPHLSTGEMTPTPEMWFYQEDLRRYQDPKMAVRQKAQYRANQRQQRLAALRWYGFSNSRPTAASDPFHSDYSPKWTGGSDNYPNRWVGRPRPLVVLRPGVMGIY